MNPRIQITKPGERVTCDGHPMGGRAATYRITVAGRAPIELCDECAAELATLLPVGRERAPTSGMSAKEAESKFVALPVVPPRVQP